MGDGVAVLEISWMTATTFLMSVGISGAVVPLGVACWTTYNPCTIAFPLLSDAAASPPSSFLFAALMVLGGYLVVVLGFVVAVMETSSVADTTRRGVWCVWGAWAVFVLQSCAGVSLIAVSVIPVWPWDKAHVLAAQSYFAFALAAALVGTTHASLYYPHAWSTRVRRANMVAMAGLGGLMLLFHLRIVWFDVFGVHQLVYSSIELLFVLSTIASFVIPSFHAAKENGLVLTLVRSSASLSRS